MIKKRIMSIIIGMVLVLASGTAAFADGQLLSKSIYKTGTRDEDVQVIQKALKKDGLFTYPKLTNYYGSITENAVKSFQKKHGLFADGVAGPVTIQKMEGLGLLESMPVSVPLVNRSKSISSRYGQALDWWSEVKGKIINRDDVLLIKDFQTGKSFQIAVEGGTNHADVEPLTEKDAETIKSLWGGNYSWERRAVLVVTKTNVIAASMNGMPHAGLDNQPYKAVVNSRSAGYGRGINYDMVKGNGVDGHFCLHFKNSTLHKNGKVDYKHQQAIKRASGQIK
ncbi:Putative peptidoglycan binding domain-containing protein [Peptoclostridium litorale DSM 5388]|uniref:N-acetylmuramoyl-L-alanine amidase n=1 Tax=Peptoclostridium litorale DSM 5388 TaxID=1121324 RepID=A0A069RKY5_PEPLI|nr:peptidoglycan-binding domain-containing protein [Peptoclostridium litorale]KDR96780.1 N-acetylmuramoyl-L-alanine amidase [Peptoclostridium litorale DSM 5388]SIO34468.1 Putative peptidoglycan binding domain-containing protein [Peptoclostridium litorale DSM 5388]